MLIIWGFRSRVQQLWAGRVRCPGCGETALMRLIQRRRWFTFFFIPVIPFSTCVFATHACCGAGGELTKQQVEEFLAPMRVAA